MPHQDRQVIPHGPGLSRPVFDPFARNVCLLTNASIRRRPRMLLFVAYMHVQASTWATWKTRSPRSSARARSAADDRRRETICGAVMIRR